MEDKFAGRTSFQVWPSYYDAVSKLPDEQRLAVYDAMFAYGVDGVEPEFDNYVCEAIFTLIRPNIDNSIKAIENGRKGGKSKRGKDESHLEGGLEAPFQGGLEAPHASKRDGDGEYERDTDSEKDGETEIDGESERSFAAFWAAYPKKTKKQEARAAFQGVTVSLDKILSAIEQQKRSAQWHADGGRYIPAPATWLRERGYEDELPEYRPDNESSVDKIARLMREGAFDETKQNEADHGFSFSSLAAQIGEVTASAAANYDKTHPREVSFR